MNFESLALCQPLLDALESVGYSEPTPIQAQAIPPLLEGRDMLGCAQTGTGKTAAFALPILNKLALNPTQGRPVIRALVLCPTRELASQIKQCFVDYSANIRCQSAVVFGGVSARSQIGVLRRGVDVLVATPGRLLDLQDQGYIRLDQVEFFVLDEADRMLDMGFIHDIRKVLKFLPKKRQNLLFSATMPEKIVELGSKFLDNPARVEITPQATTVEAIEQSLMFVAKSDKRKLLTYLIQELEPSRALVFSRTKHGANRMVKNLDADGVTALAIHGNKSQGARERALGRFRTGELKVLVATDVASRGIDVQEISHVINVDLPNEPEVYVHRIGRTGRAGLGGRAISFCDEEEGEYLRSIEYTIRQEIEVDEEHPYHSEEARGAKGLPAPKKIQRQRSPRGGGGTRGRSGGGQRGGHRGGSRR
jgi:ATP-dependent RNA helicase RhlE